MKQRARRYFTQTEMEEVWDRWERGESLNSIARGLERGHSAVQGMLSRTGGIRPAPRTRSRLALTLAEREEISRGIAAGMTMRAIAS
jgi:IS30 family transposase